MGVRLLALLQEQLRLDLQLLELAREDRGEVRERDMPWREAFEVENLGRLTRYQEQREGILVRIGLLQEAVARRCEEIEIASLPPALRERAEAVCHQMAAAVQEIRELDHPLQQKLVAWQEGILEEIKAMQEGKKALAAYKPSGKPSPRFLDGKV